MARLGCFNGGSQSVLFVKKSIKSTPRGGFRIIQIHSLFHQNRQKSSESDQKVNKKHEKVKKRPVSGAFLDQLSEQFWTESGSLQGASGQKGAEKGSMNGPFPDPSRTRSVPHSNQRVIPSEPPRSHQKSSIIVNKRSNFVPGHFLILCSKDICRRPYFAPASLETAEPGIILYYSARIP